MRRQKATNELVIRSLLHAKKQHLHNDSATLYFLYIIDSSQSKEKVGLLMPYPATTHCPASTYSRNHHYASGLFLIAEIIIMRQDCF